MKYIVNIAIGVATFFINLYAMMIVGFSGIENTFFMLCFIFAYFIFVFVLLYIVLSRVSKATRSIARGSVLIPWIILCLFTVGEFMQYPIESAQVVGSIVLIWLMHIPGEKFCKKYGKQGYT